MKLTSPRYLLAGQLSRDYVLLPSGQARLDILGGNVLYAAVGTAVWEKDPPPGILARVGEDYPSEWIEAVASHGLDTRGVKVLPQSIDLRAFVAFSSLTKRSFEEPVIHFARAGLPFPTELLGYRDNSRALNSRTQLSPVSLRQGDIPPDFLDASAAHLCPIDYLTHSLLPAVLRQAEVATVTLDPASGYMNPTFWNDVPALITGLTAFLPAEEDLRALFQGHSQDLWEMAEALAVYGCEIVVIKRGESGQWLYDAGNRTRWEIPSYPSRMADPTGAGDAFCGGFLAGFRQTYDALEAALHGNISASLVVEGSGPFYALDAMPGLAQARLEALRTAVRKL